MIHSGRDFDEGFEKVVVHLENGVIKGFLESRAEDTLDGLLQNAACDPPALLRIRPVGEDTLKEIPIQSTKAVFFVKEFDGDPQHKDLRFYRGAPIVHTVWVRVEFMDGEIMEGFVHNTTRFLVDAGFFMRPTDPYSNSRFVYVLKRWLKEFRILGLRNI